MPKIKHHGSIRRRGDAWQIRLCVGGKRYSYTIRGTFAEAASYANTMYDELVERDRRRRAGLPGEMACSELIRRFRSDVMPDLTAGTRKSYNDSLKPIEHYLVNELGDPDVCAVSRGQLAGFLRWRRAHRLDGEGRFAPAKKRVSARTVQKDRTVLHTLFELALDLEVRDDNPVRRVKPPKAPKRTPVIPSADAYERLLLECSRARQPMLALYALTLGETGARSESEALWLRWQDVDLEGGFLWIDSDPKSHETKDREGRWVPMTPRLVAAMRDHFAAYRFASYAGRRPEWVFHHTRSRRRHKAGARIRSMRRAFKAAAKRAGLPANFHQHDLRHRRVTTWLAEGRDVVHVKEAVGHSDLRTTMGYTHLSREHLRDLVATQPGAEEARAGAT